MKKRIFTIIAVCIFVLALFIGITSANNKDHNHNDNGEDKYPVNNQNPHDDDVAPGQMSQKRCGTNW